MNREKGLSNIAQIEALNKTSLISRVSSLPNLIA